MNMSRFEYVTYIATTPEKLWKALVDPEDHKKVLATREHIGLATRLEMGASQL